jgi:hypothetical protein
LDWAKRIKEAGWKVYYNPAVTVLHIKRASSRQNQRRSRVEFERANLRFYRKHYQAGTPAWLNMLILLALAARGGHEIRREIWGRQASQG